MEYVIIGLSFFLIPIIMSGIVAFLRQPKKREKGKVCLPKSLVIIGLIASLVFLIPAFIIAFSDEPIWESIFFFAFSLLGITLIIAFINCRISYDEDGFVVKSFFGIKRHFTYGQITGIKEDLHEDYIYVGKRKVAIDSFSIGRSEFIKFVNKKYMELHSGKSLPKIQKTKYDVFNGNVYGATGFMVVYILVGAIMIGLLILAIWYVFFTPATVNNTIEQQSTFKSYVSEDEEFILISTDNQIYKIQFTNERFNAEAIKSICDGKTVVTTYSYEVTPDDEDNFYSVKAILHNGTYILSFDETNRLFVHNLWPIIIILVVICLIWGAYVAGSIIVGRNPKKYSKKVVNLFFKDGYVKY